MRKNYFLLAGFMLLSGCATAIEGSTHSMTIETPGALTSVCYVENSEARYKVHPPETVLMTKFSKPFIVDCLAVGNRHKKVLVTPKIEDVTYLNVFNGVIPGAAADYNSNSMFTMPDKVVVDFNDVPAERMPLPNYEYELRRFPQIGGMENFLPDVPALPGDSARKPYVLQKSKMGKEADAAKAEAAADSAAVSSDMIIGSQPSSSAASSSTSSSASADSLTKQMNPQVFGGSAVESGAGTSGSSAPIKLHPPM